MREILSRAAAEADAAIAPLVHVLQAARLAPRAVGRQDLAWRSLQADMSAVAELFAWGHSARSENDDDLRWSRWRRALLTTEPAEVRTPSLSSLMLSKVPPNVTNASSNFEICPILCAVAGAYCSRDGR